MIGEEQRDWRGEGREGRRVSGEWKRRGNEERGAEKEDEREEMIGKGGVDEACAERERGTKLN